MAKAVGAVGVAAKAAAKAAARARDAKRAQQWRAILWPVKSRFGEAGTLLCARPSTGVARSSHRLRGGMFWKNQGGRRRPAHCRAARRRLLLEQARIICVFIFCFVERTHDVRVYFAGHVKV